MRYDFEFAKLRPAFNYWMPVADLPCRLHRLILTLLLSCFAISFSTSQGYAQSCSLADVNTVNAALSAPGAGGPLPDDVLEIDFDDGGAITCGTATGNANTAFNDRAEISHCQTPGPTDLCFVVDRATAITAVNLAGPGLPAGGVSPADDTQVDLSAGTYTVAMTVSGGPVGFSFTITELAPDDQRLASQAISFVVGPPTDVTIANTNDGTEPSTNGVLTVSQDVVSPTDTVLAYSVTGTATPGLDYTALSGSVTIPAGDLTATIDVLVLDDNDIEGDETVIVTLDSITSGIATLGTTLSAINVISDDDGDIRDRIVQAFESQTHNFVSRRMALLARHSPTLYGIQNGTGCSDDPKRGSVNITGNDTQTTGAFALTMGSQNCLNSLNPYVWAEGHFAFFSDNNNSDASASTTGDFFVGYAGVSMPVNSNFHVGVMGQVDTLEDRLETGLGEVNGTGWAVGPYVSLQFLGGIQFDARAMWGRSKNEAYQTILGREFAGTFDTERWLVEGVVSGSTKVESFTIKPSAKVFYLEEKWNDYSVTDGDQAFEISASDTAIGTLSTALEISHLSEFEDFTLEPFASAEMIWTFKDPGIYNADGVLRQNNDLSALVSLGIGIASENTSFRVEGTYGGLGSDGAEYYGGTISLTHNF